MTSFVIKIAAWAQLPLTFPSAVLNASVLIGGIENKLNRVSVNYNYS